MPQGVNVQEGLLAPTRYCAHAGITPQALRSAIERGVLSQAGFRRGIDGRLRWIHTETADRELAANQTAQAIVDHAAEPTEGLENYTQAKTAKERAMARLAELKLEQERGTLVERAEVHKAAFTAARRVRDGLLSLPDRLAPILASEMDVNAIRHTLETEFRLLLNGLTERLPDDIRRPG